MRLAFMGTPDFAVPTLRALIAAGHEVAAVYTQPARPAGRGKALRPSPVAEAAEGLAVRTPERFRAPEVLAEFQRLDLDAAVVIAYGQILQPDALAAPKLGCINLHASLLPRWRGAAPIQRAIMAGDAETGVGVMQMEAGLDTGPVFLEQRTQIEATDTAGTLHDRLAEMSAALIVEALPRIANGTLAATPQASAGISYASKIDKAEARIDWTRTADDVDRQIRGLSPFPGAWCEIGGQRVKVLLSALAEGDGPPGTVLDDNLTIACGSGAVRLLRVQRAGKGAVSAQQYLNAAPLAEGTVLT